MLNCVQLFPPWLLWAGSALLLWLFVRGVHLRVSMRRWPKVRGVVREHIVRSSRDLHGPGEHRANFVVEYVAAGSSHTVQCDSPTRMGYASREHVMPTLKRFQVGKRVELYVDPRDHRRAFLYPPETAALLALSVGALFLFVVGVGIENGAVHGVCGA